MALLVDSLAKLKEISASLGQKGNLIKAHLDGGGDEGDEAILEWRTDITNLKEEETALTLTLTTALGAAVEGTQGGNPINLAATSSSTAPIENGPHNSEKENRKPPLGAQSSPSNVNVGVRISPPQKFSTGDNFKIFCQRFGNYVKLGHISDANLHLLFLTYVDDRTLRELEHTASELTEVQRRDPSLFIPIFESIMTPDTDTSTLRMEMRQLSQNPEEKVSDFAHKIREMASLAFNSSTSNGAREEACMATLMRGLADLDVKADILKSEATDFETSVAIAKKAERIKDSLSAQRSEAAADVFALNTIPTKAGNSGSSGNNREVEVTQDYQRGYDAAVYALRGRGGSRPGGLGRGGRYVFRGSCWRCSRPGHKQAQCRENPDGGSGLNGQGTAANPQL